MGRGKTARIETALAASESESGPLWIRIAKVGEYVYQGELVTLTHEDLVEIQDETRRWLKDLRALTPLDSPTPYYPPLLKDHVRAGERWGSVVDVEARGEGEQGELWAKIRPLTEILWGIQDGRYCYVSPRIVWGYTSAEGEEYRAIVEEVSLTPTPFFKDLGRLQDYLGVSCSDQTARRLELLFSDPTGGDMGMTEQERAALARAEARAEAAEAKATDLEQRLAALEASDKGKPEAPKPEQPKPEEAPAWARPLVEGQTELKRELGEMRTQLRTIQASDPAPATDGAAPPAPPVKLTLDERIKDLMATKGMSASEAVAESARLWPDEY